MGRPRKLWRKMKNEEDNSPNKESTEALVAPSQQTLDSRLALTKFLLNEMKMGSDTDSHSVLLTFLNSLDDTQWRSLRSGIKDPCTRAVLANQSKMVVDVAAQTVCKMLLPALMVILDLDDTERAVMEINTNLPPNSSLKERTAPESGKDARKETNKANMTGNLLHKMASKMNCCRLKCCSQTVGLPVVTRATPPLSAQGSRITLGSMLAQNVEILKDPVFHLDAATEVSEILRRSSPSPSVTPAPIAAVSCPEINSWSSVSDRPSAARAVSVASTLIDGFVKDVMEVSERFQAEGAAVEREPFCLRVKRDALRLKLSLQTSVRELFAPLDCCSKTTVTPDLQRVESLEEVKLQADMTLVNMDEADFSDEEIEYCTNEVLGSLMEAYRVAGVVPDLDYVPGTSVGFSPVNDSDLTDFTGKLISALQEHCRSTSPTCSWTSSEDEQEQQQSIKSLETTMVQEIPAIGLSSPNFQSHANGSVSEVIQRALRMPHLTNLTSRSNIRWMGVPSPDKADLEARSQKLVEAFAWDLEAHAQEVVLGMDSDDTTKPSSLDGRAVQDHSTEKSSTCPTTNDRIHSASRSNLLNLKNKLVELFKTGPVTKDTICLTPREATAGGTERPVLCLDSDNADEKAVSVMSEIFGSMKTRLAAKTPSVSSIISEGTLSLEARLVVADIMDTLEVFTSSSGTVSPTEERPAEVQGPPQTSSVPSQRTNTMAKIISSIFKAKAKESVSAAVLKSFVDISYMVGPSISLPQLTVAALDAVCLPQQAEEVVELFVSSVRDECQAADQPFSNAESTSTIQQFVEHLQEKLRRFYTCIVPAIVCKIRAQSESCLETTRLSISEHFLETTTKNVFRNIVSAFQETDVSEGEEALAQVMTGDIHIISAVSPATLPVSPGAKSEDLTSDKLKTSAATQRLQGVLQECLCPSGGVEAGAVSEPAHGCLEKAAREVVGYMRRMLWGSWCAGKSSQSGTQMGKSVMEHSKFACVAVSKPAEVGSTCNNLTRAKESLSQVLVAVRDQEQEGNPHVKALAGAILENIHKLPEDNIEDVDSLSLFVASSEIHSADSDSSSQLLADPGYQCFSVDNYRAMAALARLEEVVAQGILQTTTEELVGKLQTLLKSEESFHISLPAGKSTSDSVLSRLDVRRSGQPLKEATMELIFSFAEEAVKQLLLPVFIPPPSWGLVEDNSFSSRQSESSSICSSHSSWASDNYDKTYDETVSLFATVLVSQVMSAIRKPSSHSGLYTSSQDTVRKEDVSVDGSVNGVDKDTSAKSKDLPIPLSTCPVCHRAPAKAQKKGLVRLRERFNNWKVCICIYYYCEASSSAMKKDRNLESTTDTMTTDTALIPKDEDVSTAPAKMVDPSVPCCCARSSKKEKRDKPHKSLLQAFRDTKFCCTLLGCMTKKAN